MTPDPDALRIGHAERDRAVAILQDACGDGRLRLDELDARVEAALAARTAADLRPLLADLIPPERMAEVLASTALAPTWPASAAAAAAAASGAPGWSPEDPLMLTSTLGDIKKFGAWDFPPFVEIQTVAGTVKLNCLEAHALAPLLDVTVRTGAGDVIVVVPAGWGVDTSRIATGVGSLKTTVAPRPDAGCPQVVLRGQVGMGDIKVRHPNAFDDWQQQAKRGWT